MTPETARPDAPADLPAEGVVTADAEDLGAPAGAPQELRFEPELRKALEAILLVVDEPVAVDVLAQVLEVGADEVEDGLIALAAEYLDQGRGFVLRRAGGGWRLYTDPGAAEYVERFVLHGRTGRLTQAALETLAIIAYKQPVTRADISEIRGVDADSGVRNLMARGLVEEVGRADSPGQPLLYGTTTAFLEKLGVDDLSLLPPLPSLVPDGPPPPEPAPGGYKAARKELDALAREEAADDDQPAPGVRISALLAEADAEVEAAVDAGEAARRIDADLDPDGLEPDGHDPDDLDRDTFDHEGLDDDTDLPHGGASHGA